jgi:hypothetical protein
LSEKLVRRATKMRKRLSSGDRRAVYANQPTSAIDSPPARQREVLFYPPGIRPGLLPDSIPGMTVRESWRAVLASIEQQQGRDRTLNVAVYPCSPLHCLELTGAEMRDHLAAGAAAG